MTLLTLFRALFARRPAGPMRTSRRARLALQFLEAREVPAVGGGFTAGGLFGEYYANATLSGTPSFTRRDVRVDFDWQDRAPGGSRSPEYQQVGADRFSVRWTGQLVPRFNETYTFRTTSDDGVRVWIRPTMSADWAMLIDNWSVHAPTDNVASYALQAGRQYDVRIEYYDAGGNATAKLRWSSPSTPEEVIDPAVNLGVNAESYDDHAYADAARAGRPEWGDPTHYFSRPNVPTDAAGWPLGDAAYIFWEGRDPARTAGTYLLRFTGRAEVQSWYGRGQFVVNGKSYGSPLPAGVGYDPGSNTTTAQVVVADADLFALTFRQTRRTANGLENSGITNVQLLRPTAAGGQTSYPPGTLFAADVKDAFSRFTTLRYLTANFNAERNWSDRKLPGAMKGAWGDRHAVWENEILLANETGKDLYVTIPINASEEYVRKLALLIRYGSDGVQPYAGPVANPVYPGLNPNLRLYVEWANETWNWAFTQAHLGAGAARDAVLNRTPDGQIINYDGKREQGDWRRWTALQTVKASQTFRSVWGDSAMGDRVRVVLEYQYDNVQDTAVEALKFIDNYFNNADGRPHVGDPRPVNYYIWGAGGASYFGASNPLGLEEGIPVPDGGFEGGRSPWAFTGNAALNRRPDDTPGRALALAGDATATVTIDFPRAGVYAIAFTGAAGPGGSNPLDFYFDDQRVTPNWKDLVASRGPWTPGNGYGKDRNKFDVYGTVPVPVAGPGRHTFRIVGRGMPGQTTLIDDVRVASTDAIFASRLPGGGQAAGQVSRSDYQGQLMAQAKYALDYGLKVVAYEGGWSLGGDTQSVPIQNWAKYRDGRATDAMAVAIDAFYRAGGELNVLGTYDQWYVEDAANASRYPLVRGIDSRLAALPSRSVIGRPPTETPAPPPAAATGLPSGWNGTAIGAPDLTGAVRFDGGRWVVQGAGHNIWGSADQFQFASVAADGDVLLEARVDDLTRTHGWAKAGLMVRDGVGESAAFAAVFRTPDNGIVFETRAGQRATPDSVGVPVGAGPVWVRLVRRADSFAGFYSLDGQRWTRIGEAQTIPMPGSVQVGLAVTSHDPTQLATATFSSVAVVD